GALTAERPHYFFLSDLESRDLLRLGRDDARRLLSALEGLYTGREIIAPNAFLPHYWSWLAPPRSWAPPDWLYPSPVITMYYNPR
ncbi:MAG: hypothetical protein GTN78_01765, partial [Gemmatimonadales bacterium]|nr:hypothetical protein [Gemmatimonadales bacterium]